MKKIIIKLTGLKLIASLVGLVYSVAQVRFFGASAQMDAYFVAMSAVYMITSLIQGGQLSEIFLPEYIQQKTKCGDKPAHKLLSAILNRLTFIIILILIMLYFVSSYLINMIGPGLDFESKLLSTRLFNISLLLIYFTLIGSFVNTTLNAEQVFGRTEFTALLNGLISIGILFFCYEKFGVFTLIYALLVGKIVELLIGLHYLRKIGYQHHFIWNANNGYNVSKFFKVMLTTSGYVGATQIYSVTMTAMASYLPTGSLSIFNYVTQLTTKASGIIIGPITTVFFSNFSKIVSEQKENLTEYLKKPIVYVFMTTFLVFIFIFLFGDELLHFLWSNKSLSASEFEIAYIMLFLNFFGFIFTATSSIFRKSSIALGHSGQLYRSWIIVQLFSAIYAFVLIYFFGVNGLISILIINMILTSLTTFYVSEQAKLKSKEILTEFIFKNKNIYVIAAMLICTVGFNFLLNSFSASKFIILTTKFIIWLICVLFYLSYLNQHNFLKLVNTFLNKKIN